MSDIPGIEVPDFIDNIYPHAYSFRKRLSENRHKIKELIPESPFSVSNDCFVLWDEIVLLCAFYKKINCEDLYVLEISNSNFSLIKEFKDLSLLNIKMSFWECVELKRNRLLIKFFISTPIQKIYKFYKKYLIF